MGDCVMVWFLERGGVIFVLIRKSPMLMMGKKFWGDNHVFIN